MTTDELNALAHQIAYPAAKSAIESFTNGKDYCVVEADGVSTRTTWAHRYDLRTPIIGEFERECVARAIFYLDARQLLLRKPGEPYMVQVLPEPATGALVPPTLAEALSA